MSTVFLWGLQEAQGCLIEVGGGRLTMWVILGESNPMEIAQIILDQNTNRAT